VIFNFFELYYLMCQQSHITTAVKLTLNLLTFKMYLLSAVLASICS